VVFTIRCVDCEATAVAISYTCSVSPICQVSSHGPMRLEGWVIHQKLWSLGPKRISVVSDSKWGIEAYKHYECTRQIGDKPLEVIRCGR
jgi:hypothetical protein